METSIETTLKYKSIVKSNGIYDEVCEVNVKDSGLQGAGVASQQLYVTVKFNDSKIKPLNLFVKAHTSNPSHSEMVKEMKSFENESRFLTEYVPAAKEFCKSKGQEGLMDFYPKCYYGDENLVVLENLVLDKGYSLLNADEKQDMEAVRFALSNLAKHHAISYAFIKESGGPKPFFTRFPLLDSEKISKQSCRKTFGPVIENNIKSNIQILENNDVPGKEDTIQKLKFAVGRSYDMIIEPMKSYNEEEEKLFVLNHGYKNIIYSSEANNCILKTAKLYPQITHYNSLGLDVGYYLYTSVDPKVRRAHWKEILEMYLTTFKETALKLGHPMDLSYEELLLIVRKKINNGFWISMGFCCEAGFAALKEINLNEVGDMDNFSAEFSKKVQVWIDANPEKVKEIKKKLVMVFD